jgi:hypothetical protein
MSFKFGSVLPFTCTNLFASVVLPRTETYHNCLQMVPVVLVELELLPEGVRSVGPHLQSLFSNNTALH